MIGWHKNLHSRHSDSFSADCHAPSGPGATNECLPCRPFVQRYMILVANGRGAYHPIDVESMDQVQAGEYVRKILQAARVDGWQV